MKKRFSFTLPSGGNRVVLTGRGLLLLCLLGMLGALLASCSSGPRMGMDAEGEPVEHKVFYEGWSWSKSKD